MIKSRLKFKKREDKVQNVKLLIELNENDNRRYQHPLLACLMPGNETGASCYLIQSSVILRCFLSTSQMQTLCKN